MKKVLFAGLMAGALAFSLTGCGGHDKTTVYKETVYTDKGVAAGIPREVSDEFYEDYPSAQEVHWKTKNGLYEADFEIDHKDMKATYTPDGDLVKVDS